MKHSVVCIDICFVNTRFFFFFSISGAAFDVSDSDFLVL